VTSPPVIVNDVQSQLQQMYGVITNLQQQLANVQQQPAAASARPFLPKLRPPSTYSGSMRFGEVDKFINEMEQQFTYYGSQFPNDSARIHFAAAALDGTARQWWTSHPDRATMSAWAQFVGVLRSRFRPMQADMIARQNLFRLRMSEKHSVAQYASVFQATLLHISDMSTTDQIHSFMRGLPRKLQEKVWERQPESLVQAIDFAVSAEAWGNYSNSVGMGHFPRGSTGGSTSHGTSAPMDINHLSVEDFLGGTEDVDSVSAQGPSFDAATIAALVSTAVEQRLNAMMSSTKPTHNKAFSSRVGGLKEGEIQKLMRESKCFRCKKTGHMKNDPSCPLLSKSKNE
jgi:Ty3 transposon capsid-like protein